MANINVDKLSSTIMNELDDGMFAKIKALEGDS